MSLTERLSYYPPISPYASHRLAVTAPHNLYIEECGNPNGIPILIVHGGPGGGCSEDSRRYCDPKIYRIILFDQRGAGRSTPAAELQHNNTLALVNDIEAIRNFLKIDRWLLLGGSWGSTLSLVYAQTHPQYVLGCVLRSIFLARPKDINWFLSEDGARQFFPDHWQQLIEPIAPEHRHNLALMYSELLMHPDQKIQEAAASHWAAWGAQSLTLIPNQERIRQFISFPRALNEARIECHYFLNNCFMEPNQILHNMQKISHLPAIIIHGRYDIFCPLDNAWQLHQAWPRSELHIIPDAAHAGSEPGILDAVIRATQKIAAST